MLDPLLDIACSPEHGIFPGTVSGSARLGARIREESTRLLDEYLIPCYPAYYNEHGKKTSGNYHIMHKCA